jgi:glycosyltransferase involved in cell wall biosynthesis
MKLAFAHTGVGPFVQQTARSLLEAGLLANYWTTFADQPEARWRRSLVRLASAIGVNIERELRRRAVQEVPSVYVRRSPFWEVLRTLLTKLRADRRLVDAIWEHGTLTFDRCVARRGLDGVNGIYGYEYSALASFQEAKKRGLARVYEVPSAEHDFVENLIQHEIEQFPELDDGKRQYFLARQHRRTERRRLEWALADVVIVNSKFTRDSYAAAGLDVGKVRIVPLGAPTPCGEGSKRVRAENEPLRVLWAGSFGIHKGAHYLLAAWDRIASKTSATLDIYGTVRLPDNLMRCIPASVRVYPTIPRSELFERYCAADVLAFPTLSDGFGMVVTEAFAHGLPVITTPRAGASDLVRHEANGLIVPAADVQALADALEWCAVHREQLRMMRYEALRTAARWQWSDYRLALAKNVIGGLREAGYAE